MFKHLTSLSPSFFDTAHSGELVSRLTADTTQIKSAVGASVSIALRNLVLFVGASAMMVVTSPKLSGIVLAVIPLIVLPLVAFGRRVQKLSRGAQDTLAEASSYASELIGAIRTLQAFTNERLAEARFGGEVERAYVAARNSTRARAFLTATVIFLIFTSVVAILWIGSHDVLTKQISAGRLGQFILYAAFAAGCARRTQSGVGRDLAASGRGRNGCSKSCASSRISPRLQIRARCRCRRAATLHSTMCGSPIRHGRITSRSTASRSR